MADQTDILDMLANAALAAVFPNGTSNPSVTGRPIDIGIGWPEAASLDQMFKANPPRSQVSVIPVNGTTSRPGTRFDTNPGIIVPATHGLSVVVDEGSFTRSGPPNVGENIAVLMDRAAYSYQAQAGDTAQVVTAMLAQKIPGASRDDATVQVPGDVLVRIGGVATIGHVIDTQIQRFQVTVWAPSPADRSTIAQAIDVYVKQRLKVILPDTSEAIILGAGSNLDDSRQKTSGYHRTLIYRVQWDTLETWQAWEIVSVGISTTAKFISQTLSA